MFDRRLAPLIVGSGLILFAGSVEGRQVQPPGPAVDPPPAADRFRLPDDRIGRRIAPILLLSREDVRSDLKLDERQVADAEQAMGELHERAAALRGKSGAEVVERRREIDQACEGWITQYLTESQRARLAQISLQWEGPAALSTQPALAEQVGLSADQRRQLADAVARRDQRRGSGTPVLEAERELTDSALGILKSNQQERWMAMLGPAFTPVLVDRDVVPVSGPNP